MTYKGEEIGIPCVEMVQEYINEFALSISADEVLDYWRKKNFLTKKGLPVKTLEALVNVVNSIYVQKNRKLATGSVHKIENLKAEKWLKKNFAMFCEYMSIIKTNNPQMWKELNDEYIKLTSPS